MIIFLNFENTKEDIYPHFLKITMKVELMMKKVWGFGVNPENQKES